MAARGELPKKLLTFTGVVPLGLFLVEHLLVNASALGGAARFEAVAGAVVRSRWLPPIEIGLVLLPLAFHALYGLHILVGRKAPVREYPALADRMVLLQRVSSVVVLVFVAAHLWELRVHRALHATPTWAIHARLAEHMSWTKWGMPWIAIGYLVGVTAAVFHFANGLWAFGVSYKGVTGEREKRRAAVVPFGIGAILFVVAAATIVTLAAGGGLLPEPESERVPCGTSSAAPVRSGP
jgi:succinate dehydrogenase / fumarate reductase cytochrome b subunit